MPGRKRTKPAWRVSNRLAMRLQAIIPARRVARRFATARSRLGDAVTDPDPPPPSAFDAMMGMTKIEIATIEAARRG